MTDRLKPPDKPPPSKPPSPPPTTEAIWREHPGRPVLEIGASGLGVIGSRVIRDAFQPGSHYGDAKLMSTDREVVPGMLPRLGPRHFTRKLDLQETPDFVDTYRGTMSEIWVNNIGGVATKPELFKLAGELLSPDGRVFISDTYTRYLSETLLSVVDQLRAALGSGFTVTAHTSERGSLLETSPLKDHPYVVATLLRGPPEGVAGYGAPLFLVTIERSPSVPRPAELDEYRDS